MIEWNWKTLLTLLFPPKCIGCGELMSVAEGAEGVFCPFCRTAWEAGRLSAADRCLQGQEHIAGLVSVVKYRPGETDGVPEKLIYHMKHRDERRVFDCMARELIPLLRQAYTSFSVCEDQILLSYPPRSRKAVRKDGFDQARRLAEAVSKGTGFPVVPLLSRTGESGEAQKYLSAEERKASAAISYRLRAGVDVRNKVVFLFDDVYTTGATLRSCARLLTDAGASGVFLATVGRTVRSVRDNLV